jgi:hypothetical protein
VVLWAESFVSASGSDLTSLTRRRAGRFSAIGALNSLRSHQP